MKIFALRPWARRIATPRSSAPVLLAALVVLAGCRDVPAGFGPTASAARANADGLLGAFAQRFTNVTRPPRYARGRELIGRSALTPSAVFNDTSVWTALGADGSRTLATDAVFVNGRYLFSNATTARPLDAPADGSHVIRLRKLSDSDYEWLTNVDFAVGTIAAADFATLVNRLLASAEGRNAAALRADSRSAFPRTTTVMGRLLTMDTLLSLRDAQGGNTVYLSARITPNGVRAQLPNFAAYLDKYVGRTRTRITLSDRSGAKWLDMALGASRFTLRVRSRDGRFAPLEGAVRPIPESLQLRMDFTTRISLFDVGFSNMVADFTIIRTERELGWAMRFTREPRWDLPPAVSYFLKSPLRRPFEGAGTQFRIVARDAPGSQTVLTRRGTTTVRESAIMRFLGRLGGTALGDFVSKAEPEENRFNAELFAAMKADVDALLP